MPNTDVNLPDYHRPEVIKVLPNLKLMADLLGGTSVMHEEYQTYIRKWTDEDPNVYLIRAKGEDVFQGLERTLSAAIGMVFAKAPTLEWNGGEGSIEEHWESIDAAGTKGHVFIKRFTDTSIRDGVGLLLIDHPSAPKDPETKEPLEIDAEMEVQMGLRPTWASYPRANIISWRTDKINNKNLVTQVVLWEPTVEPDGVFGIKVVDRYRLLRVENGVAFWTLYEKVKDTGKIEDFLVKGSGYFRNKNGEIAGELPIAIAHTGRSDKVLEATIPLLGVAHVNLSHWQMSSNLRFYCDLASFPQPTVIGELAASQGPDGEVVEGSLKIGPMVTVQLDGENSDFKYTSPGTEAFDPLERRIEAKEKHMAILGMSFLASDTRQAETAEAKRLDATAENATLATSAQGIDDAVNKAFEWHAWYMGIEKEEAPAFALNRDFESTAMDPPTMLAYVAAVEKTGLPVRLLLEAWQAGGRIPPETDLDELEMEMMAAQAAKEEKERQERMANIARLTEQPAGGNEEDEEFHDEE